eukprot:m.478407 g.478407  ORF g.478407 m.478407 type:complete len:61 (-) comp46465_c0_seq1:14-196(-)
MGQSQADAATPTWAGQQRGGKGASAGNAILTRLAPIELPMALPRGVEREAFTEALGVTPS